VVPDDHVVVQEDMVVEVRLEKPAKPEKWDLPPDISLKSALIRAKEEEQSRLDGTLAANAMTRSATTGTGTLRSQMKYKGPPRHELFLTNGTFVELSAALHRKLIKSIDQQSPGATQEAIDPSGPSATDMISLRALDNKLKVTPFTRMIVLFKFSDDDTLKALTTGIESINSHALPDIQGSIRSYSFSQAELVSGSNGTLDVITGFMILDDDWRLVVLEGLAKPGGGMSRLFIEFLPRAKANDESLKIVCNPEVLFADRIYPEFGPGDDYALHRDSSD